jgi:hypothetical protein
MGILKNEGEKFFLAPGQEKMQGRQLIQLVDNMIIISYTPGPENIF